MTTQITFFNATDKNGIITEGFAEASHALLNEAKETYKDLYYWIACGSRKADRYLTSMIQRLNDIEDMLSEDNFAQIAAGTGISRVEFIRELNEEAARTLRSPRTTTFAQVVKMYGLTPDGKGTGKAA